MCQQTFEIIVEKDGQSIPQLLGEFTGQSLQAVKQAMACGAVWIERDGVAARVRRATKSAMPGSKVIFHYAANLLAETPPKLTATEMQDDFSIWIKPRGMTISGSRFCDHTSLKRCIETQHPENKAVYVVHRLDRFTAGLIVVAHSKQAAAKLSDMFRHHEIHKVYHAWVQGRLDSAVNIEEPVDNKAARSEVASVQVEDNLSLVEVKIYTGRKHQVRRHLASIGHPVIGDRQYGQAAELDMQLAATSLGFEWNNQKVECRVPWQDLLQDL
jgi:tRNA pseudouridine32 synthase/23S rRNA pseudouridine746 synthase